MKSSARAFIIWWKDIDKWVIPKNVFLKSNFPSDWSLVKVRELVSLVKKWIKVDPNKEYKMVGIRLLW